MLGHHPLKMENRVQIPMRLPFLVRWWQTRNAAVSKTALCGSVTHPLCHFSNTLGEGNECSLTGKATALYAGVIQFESESIVEVVSNVLTLIDIECYNLTRL